MSQISTTKSRYFLPGWLHKFPNARKDVRLNRTVALTTNGEFDGKGSTLSDDSSVCNDIDEDTDRSKELSGESDSDPLAN
jgi:hypothetical protein